MSRIAQTLIHYILNSEFWLLNSDTNYFKCYAQKLPPRFFFGCKSATIARHSSEIRAVQNRPFECRCFESCARKIGVSQISIREITGFNIRIAKVSPSQVSATKICGDEGLGKINSFEVDIS